MYVGRGIKEGFLVESMLKLQVKGQIELARWTGKKGGESAPTKRTRTQPMTRDRLGLEIPIIMTRLIRISRLIRRL